MNIPITWSPSHTKTVALIVTGFFVVAMVVVVASLVANIASSNTLPADQVFKNTLVSLTNVDRKAQGVPLLTQGMLISSAAQKKADDMAANGYFEHISPAGLTPWYWFTSVKYYYWKAGENLAMNFATPEALEVAWMASPTHRENVVRSVYTQIGFGIAHGTFEGRAATFIVEFFSTPYKNYP